MKPFQTLFSIDIFLLFCSCSLAAELCPSFSCNPNRQDTIQFPFRVPRNQTTRCGYPGFDLTCGRNGQTLLPFSPNPLIVRGIDYPNQLLIASDPDSCIPNRVLDLNLPSSPYNYGPYGSTYSFLNCSRTNISTLDPDMLPMGTSVVSCLSGADYTVMVTFDKAAERELVNDKKCAVIKRLTTAFWWPEMSEGLYPADMSGAFLQLSWDVPSCGDCVQRGGSCGFSAGSGLDVVCVVSPNSASLSRGAKYGLLLGIGIPAIICMIGVTYYISSKARARTQIQNRRYANTELSPSIFPQVIVTLGLDRPTIESYPKTVLGGSKRLPKTSDGTCPICLSEYQPKETLRCIPECNHCFHADCIDEWLRMNATCPLCRKSPQQPSGR